MKPFFKKTIAKILEIEARLVLWRYKPKIVAVTGSVGKTSTKDAIYTVLATSFFVRKSEKSFNSELGVPLTVLGLQNAWSNPLGWLANIIHGLGPIVWKRRYPEWLVLEVGADRPGDIESITRWLKPDIAVMTRIGSMPVHVEFFESQTELVKEKSFLARALKPGGVLVLAGDDEDVVKFKQFAQGRVIFVSLEHPGSGPGGTGQVGALGTASAIGPDHIVGSNRAIYYEKNAAGEDMPAGMTFKVNFDGNSVPVIRKGALGLQHVYPTLYALAVGISQGLNIIPISEALSREVLTPGRMRLLKGDKPDSFIIDDSYNSSPIALHEAIKALGEINVPPGGRKIAVLGDMLELGKHSTGEHLKAGHDVAKVADILVTVGFRARSIAEGALDAELDGKLDESKVRQFDYSPEAGVYLDSILQAGDLVLVKGSQSIRMERVVEEIMAEPGLRQELLVRQDAEWEKR